VNADELKQRIQASLAELVKYADELRDLDQALGDGDLGITVTLGAEAVIEAVSALPDSATPAQIARECAKAFANANPSTMAALVAGGLLAGSKTWTDVTNITVPDAATFIRPAGGLDPVWWTQGQAACAG
jgi:phosphoenolpyruvate---glycerone phosphotransferase subunit DhaL